MTVKTQTDSARRPPPLPPFTSVLGDDEFDPESYEGILFFCLCFDNLGSVLAPDTANLLDELRHLVFNRLMCEGEVDSPTEDARFDATAGIREVYRRRRKECRATMISVRAARIVVRFNEAISRPLRTAPTLFTELAELIFMYRSGQAVISSAEVEIIKAELRSIPLVWD